MFARRRATGRETLGQFGIDDVDPEWGQAAAIGVELDPVHPLELDDSVTVVRIGRIDGCALADGTPLSTLDADRAAWDTRNVLRRLGGLTDDPRHYGAGSPNTYGAAFARAAVRTWPDSDKPP